MITLYNKMDSRFSPLSTDNFHIIRAFVGPKFPIIKQLLRSHVYERINIIEEMDIRLDITGFYPFNVNFDNVPVRCFWHQFQLDLLSYKKNKQRLTQIVALGSFTYHRNWYEWDYENRRTIPHEMYSTSECRPYWTLHEVLKKIRFWEFVVRTELMERFDNGHIFLERLSITNQNTITPSWGS